MVHQALGRTGSHSLRNGVAVIQERQMDVVGFAQQLLCCLICRFNFAVGFAVAWANGSMLEFPFFCQVVKNKQNDIKLMSYSESCKTF